MILQGEFMRFILNFFLFGILFYLIYIFFPEAFNTLVSWAGAVYGFFHDIIMGIVEKVQEKKGAEHEAPKTASLLLTWLGLGRFSPF